jgi:hypothetical protein
LIQTSEPPQKGHGRSDCADAGEPRSGSVAALLPFGSTVLMFSAIDTMRHSIIWKTRSL